MAGAARSLALIEMLNSVDTSIITDPAERREFAEIQLDLASLNADLLAHVHGNAAPGRTPDLLALNAKLTMFEAGFYSEG